MSLFRRHKEKQRHPIRNFFIVICILIGLFLAAIIGAAYYLSPQDPLAQADAIVVVSGGQTTTRAERGIQLYKQGLAPKLIFSGASLDDGPSNAREMAQQARRAGVQENDIIIDEEAQTTFQNAENTKKIAEKLNAKRLILVTSPYHQRRVLLTFQKVYGPSYGFINQSSFDNRWSKSAWWASPFGVWITVSELTKVGYVYSTGKYE